MTYWENIQQFLNDGAIYAKNYRNQLQHSISYENINNRRGTVYSTPCGNNLHDYLPFYFSPCTAMAYAISCGNVDLNDVNGEYLRKSSSKDLAFIVSHTNSFIQHEDSLYFTNVACNSMSPQPKYESDLNCLEAHVDWSVFDEDNLKAKISEIGYNGVCKDFNNKSDNVRYTNRKAKRMAEFMVKDYISLQYITCIVTNTDKIKHQVEKMIRKAGLEIPVYCKPDCYY